MQKKDALLEEIQELINIYNKNTKEPICITTKNNDISNLYIGLYDYNKIGLFKALKWSSNIYRKTPYSTPIYDAGVIYIGVNSDKISIQDLHKNNINFVCFRPIGSQIEVDKNNYICNCKMQRIINFDELRLIFYNNNQIQKYIPGLASNEEILEVLKLSNNYFNLNQKHLTKTLI